MHRLCVQGMGLSHTLSRGSVALVYFDASRCHTVVRTSGSYIHDEFVKQHILLAENGALHLVTQLRETLTPKQISNI